MDSKRRKYYKLIKRSGQHTSSFKLDYQFYQTGAVVSDDCRDNIFVNEQTASTVHDKMWSSESSHSETFEENISEMASEAKTKLRFRLWAIQYNIANSETNNIEFLML